MTMACITGTGFYVPERVVTNDDLTAFMATSDDWIRTRTGIEQRHWATEGETGVELVQQVRHVDQRGETELVTEVTHQPDDRHDADRDDHAERQPHRCAIGHARAAHLPHRLPDEQHLRLRHAGSGLGAGGER